MTPKQKVLKVYPEAFVSPMTRWKKPPVWHAWSDPCEMHRMGEGRTPQEAWAEVVSLFGVERSLKRVLKEEAAIRRQAGACKQKVLKVFPKAHVRLTKSPCWHGRRVWVVWSDGDYTHRLASASTQIMAWGKSAYGLSYWTGNKGAA